MNPLARALLALGVLPLPGFVAEARRRDEDALRLALERRLREEHGLPAPAPLTESLLEQAEREVLRNTYKPVVTMEALRSGLTVPAARAALPWHREKARPLAEKKERRRKRKQRRNR